MLMQHMSHIANDSFFKNVVLAPSERYLQQNRSKQLALMLAALHLSDPISFCQCNFFKKISIILSKVCRNK